MSAGLARYNTVSRELASLYQQRASLENAVADAWNSAYADAINSGMSYNPAAAQAKVAASNWQKELNKINGDIEAALVELRYLDVFILHVKDPVKEPSGEPG